MWFILHSFEQLKKPILFKILVNTLHFYIPIGLVVRSCAFHPQGPDSTPGLGNFLWNLRTMFLAFNIELHS